jgi:hypothetical protein
VRRSMVLAAVSCAWISCCGAQKPVGAAHLMDAGQASGPRKAAHPLRASPVPAAAQPGVNTVTAVAAQPRPYIPGCT